MSPKAQNIRPTTTESLLVIHPGALGDVITAFSLLLLLRHRFGRIDLICQKGIGKLCCYLKITENYYALESAVFVPLFSGKTGHPDKRLSKLVNRYDQILMIGFSQLLPETIHHMTPKNVYRISPRPAIDKSIHVTRHMVSQLVTLGLLKKNSENLIGTTFKDYRHHDYNPFNIIIHPGSGSLRKNWPFENFVVIMEMLQSKGYKPYMVMGPAETDLQEKMKQDRSDMIFKHFSSFKEKVIVPQDLVELANVLKSAGGYIGNDSGASHLAAFLGLPTVSVFGPSDPARWKPLGLNSATVVAEKGCKPCFENTEITCDTRECLTGISPEQVMDNFLVAYPT